MEVYKLLLTLVINTSLQIITDTNLYIIIISSFNYS